MSEYMKGNHITIPYGPIDVATIFTLVGTVEGATGACGLASIITDLVLLI